MADQFNLPEKLNTSPVSLNTPNYELEQKLIEETDLDELKNIVNIFNLNIKKKDLLRVGKISDLQDKIVEQMTERMTKKAGEFSNADLLNYFKISQDTLHNSNTNLTDVPQIQINQNQLNINMDGSSSELSRESKNKVAEAIKAILNKAATTSTNASTEPELIKEDTSDIIEVDNFTEATNNESNLSED